MESDIITYQLNRNMGNHVMDSFEFESGMILNDVNVEYVTSGIPKYDDDGNIINAIVYCPNMKGGFSLINEFNHSFGNQFNRNDFFFIRIVSLGTPNSCSPSTTGLNHNFPQYTLKDRVNFKKQFISEKFNINRVLGIVGEGLGGYELLTWACEYPDDMEFIIAVNTSFKTYGYRYVFSKCVEAIIDSTEELFSEEYSSSVSKNLVAINRVLFLAFFPKKVFENFSNDEIDALMDDYVDEGLFVDIHDFKFRNDCVLEFDVKDKLSNIKAKSLIVGVEGNILFKVNTDVMTLVNSIEDSQYIVFDQKEDYFDEKDYSEGLNGIAQFINQFKK